MTRMYDDFGLHAFTFLEQSLAVDDDLERGAEESGRGVTRTCSVRAYGCWA